MKYAIFVLSIFLLIYLVMEFNSRTAELNRLTAEREVISTRLESRKQTIAALEAQIAFATSDAAVWKWAYENHLARPGDYIVVPIQVVQSTPTPTPQPVVTATEVSNLQRWLSLFVDQPIP